MLAERALAQRASYLYGSEGCLLLVNAREDKRPKELQWKKKGFAERLS